MSDRALCSRCLRSFRGEELAASGGDLLCPECQAKAARLTMRPPAAPGQPAVAQPQTATASSAPAAPAAVQANDDETTNIFVRTWRDAMKWCCGRWWWMRLPLLLLFAYYLVQHMRDMEYQSFLFGAINLGFHELGHFLFRPFGEFMHVAGGTILQCLMPFVGMVVLLRQRDYFGALLCFGWLATNLFGVSLYCRDALDQMQVLVVPGEGAMMPGESDAHDWVNMLERFNCLQQARDIAAVIRVGAIVSMLLFLIPGAYLLWRMWLTRNDNPEPDPET